MGNLDIVERIQLVCRDNGPGHHVCRGHGVDQRRLARAETQRGRIKKEQTGDLLQLGCDMIERLADVDVGEGNADVERRV